MDQQTTSPNPELALNLTRHLIALSAALVYSLIYIFLFYKEYTRLSGNELMIFMSVFWAGNIAFTILSLSRLNKLFHDGNITMLQLVWATLFALVAVYYLNDMREIILMFYFVMLCFGFFRFKSYQFFLCGILAVVGYLLVIFLLLINEPLRITLSKEILLFLSFTVTTLFVAYTGYAISKLRVELRHKNEDLAKAVELNTILATTDDLTGLYTRRYFMEVLNKQKAITERDDSDFVVCFADLDHFKHVNDGFGHHTGDIVLQQFSEIINNSIREIDYAARFGGEEFVLLLVNSDIEQALNVTERIREALEHYNFSDVAPALNVTVSIGLANFKSYNSLQETLMSADNRMYKAKEKGRNQIIYS